MTVAEGHFAYMTSMAEAPGNLYPWLWLAITELGQNRDVPRASVPAFDKTSWPAPVVNLFLDALDVDAALWCGRARGRLGSKGTRLRGGFYYVGEWLLFP